MANKPAKPLLPKLETMLVIFPTIEKPPKNLPKINSEKIETPKSAANNLPTPPTTSVAFAKICISELFFFRPIVSRKQ